MLTLDLSNAPQWCDLMPGVRGKLRPLTTALMVSARGDPAIADLPASKIREVANAGLDRSHVLAFWFGDSD